MDMLQDHAYSASCAHTESDDTHFASGKSHQVGNLSSAPSSCSGMLVGVRSVCSPWLSKFSTHWSSASSPTVEGRTHAGTSSAFACAVRARLLEHGGGPDEATLVEFGYSIRLNVEAKVGTHELVLVRELLLP